MKYILTQIQKYISHISFILFIIITSHGVSAADLPSSIPSLAPILEHAIPAVVNIKTLRFQPSEQAGSNDVVSGLASGVIVKKLEDSNDATNTYIILTNQHAVAGADQIAIFLDSGEHFDATLIGSDAGSDIAALKIQSKEELTLLPMGNSDALQVGDFVVAIGNPFGLEQSVTSGIVSALSRQGLGLEGYEDFIQTDASINPGNSGGALINLKGELIGINTALLSPLSSDGGNIGISFAIPINMANSILAQLLNTGEVRRGLLGVIAQTLTPEFTPAFGLPSNATGALITQIVPDTIAEHADIEVGDIITQVNDQSITNATALRNNIGLIPIDEEFSLTLIHQGSLKTISLTMLDPSSFVSLAESIHPQLAGSELGEVDEYILGHGHVQGVILLDVASGSPADQAGLAAQDIIVSANHQPVESIADLRQAAMQNNELLLLRTLRGRGALYLLIN